MLKRTQIYVALKSGRVALLLKDENKQEYYYQIAERGGAFVSGPKGPFLDVAEAIDRARDADLDGA